MENYFDFKMFSKNSYLNLIITIKLREKVISEDRLRYQTTSKKKNSFLKYFSYN